MLGSQTGYLNESAGMRLQDRYRKEKRRQPGIAFPSASSQENLFIIRFDISDHLSDDRDRDTEIVRIGLRGLCSLFNSLAIGKKKIEQLTESGELKSITLSEFKFSSTIGFGLGFFKKLKITKKNWPRNLKEMPDYSGLQTLLRTHCIKLISLFSSELMKIT